jgi:tetratricopeptide (TPR) repeat protein
VAGIALSPGALAQDYPSAETGAAFRDGMKSFYAGRFEEAAEKFQQVYAAFPLDGLNLAFLADCYAKKRELNEFIGKIEKEVMAKGEDAQSLTLLGFAYYLKARSMPGISVDDALRELESALKQDSKISFAYTVRGLIYFDKRMMSRAKNYFATALQLNPKDLIAAEHLANIMMVDEKKHEDALMYFKAMTDICPDYADPWFYVGACNQYLGRSDEAITAFKKNMELDQKGIIKGYWSAVRIGDILMNRKMYGESLSFYEKSLEMSPGSTYSKFKIEQCRKNLKPD